MDQIKLVGIGTPHAALYGGRQNPSLGAGPQVAHQQQTRKFREHDKRPLDGPSYKTATISPPMVRTSSNTGGVPAAAPQPPAGVTPSVGGIYPSAVAYPPPPQPAAGDTRYMSQTLLTTGTYRQEPYQRSMDRPLLITHNPRRPTIMGHYGAYGSRPAEMVHMMPGGGGVSSASVNVSSCGATGTISVATKVDNSKRIKLTPTPLMKPDIRMTGLHVDTDTHTPRESSYYPQVEAISPTPTDTRDDSPDLNKAQILKQIEMVDHDILKYEANISKMTKKAEELEAAASQVPKEGDEVPDQVEEESKTKNQGLAETIYAANKRKAEEAHKSLFKVNAKIDGPEFLPLYHQPSDIPQYENNKLVFFNGLKTKLIEGIKKDSMDKLDRVERLTNTYSKLRTEWLRKIDKSENCKKHKEKMGKNRELFEKVFSELRKQREDRERFTRVGARVKSDAEMEEIMDGLQEQENEEKKMRSYAVIPPIMLDDVRRSHRFNNKNGLIDDPVREYKESKNVNIWTEHEKDIFREKYLQHPKNFVLIASYLEKKTVADCIQYYYNTKKKENYKSQVRRRRPRARPTKGAATVNAPQASVLEVVGLNSTGVTTRQSVAALQKEQQAVPSSRSDNSSSPCPPPTSSSPVPSLAQSSTNSTTSVTSISASSTATTSFTPSTSTSQATDSNSLSSSTSSSVPPSSSTSTAPHDTLPSSRASSPSKSVVTTTVTTAVTTIASSLSSSKEDTNRSDGKDGLTTTTTTTIESSEDEPMDVDRTGGAHKCCVCSTSVPDYSGSQRLLPSQHSLYGLPPLAPGAPPRRVCHVCRMRTNPTSEHPHHNPQCPVGSCTTNKWKVRKLRSLPSRWHLLSSDITDPIIREMQLPPGITRCCSRCHQRLVSLLGSHAAEPAVDPSSWGPHEVHVLREALMQFGRHWSRVCTRVPGKTDAQCKSFYNTYKNNPQYKLEEAVAQYKLSRGKTGSYSLSMATGAGDSSSDSSGSSTESCEESTHPPTSSQQQPRSQSHRDSTSDTASASSPVPGRVDLDLTKEDGPCYESTSANGRESPEVQHIPHPGENIPHKPQHQASPMSIHPIHHEVEEPSKSSSVRDIIAKCIEHSLGEPSTPTAPPNENQATHYPAKVSSQPHGRPEKVPLPPPDAPGFPNTNYSWPAPNWGGSTAPTVISDPRSGLPRIPMPMQEDIGLDLSVKKRDRSPPVPQTPSYSSSSHHGSSSSTGPSPQPPPGREGGHPITVQGGAEIIITNKDHQAPPIAHTNSVGYSKPPSAYYDHYQGDIRNKSPSPYAPDSRSLAPPNIISGSMPRVTSPHLLYSGQIRQQQMPKPTKSLNQQQQLPTSSTTRIIQQTSSSQQHSPATVSRIPLKPEKALGMHGSITQGTPVNQSLHSNPSSPASRYEMIPKQVGSREGSITQGTPIHEGKRSGGITLKDGVTYEPRPGTGIQIIPRSVANSNYERDLRLPQRLPVSSASSSYYTSSYYARPPYSVSHIESNKAIVETDFITSQQLQRTRPGVSDKDIRVSPRPTGRDPSPQSDPRDHRNIMNSVQVDRRDINAAVVNQRVLDPRSLDPREQHRVTVEHRAIDQRHIDHRFTTDPRQLDHRIVDPRSIDPRALEQHRSNDHRSDHHRSDHPVVEILSNDVSTIARSSADSRSASHSYSSSYPSHSQAYFINSSDASLGHRPVASPASVRDATPTPPNSETNHSSPHEYHPSMVNSHPPPPPPNRVRSVISRQAMPPQQSQQKNQLASHYGPPKSASPRNINMERVERYSPSHHENLRNLADVAAAAKHSMVSLANVEIRRDMRGGGQQSVVSVLSAPHEGQSRPPSHHQQDHDRKVIDHRQFTTDGRMQSVSKLDGIEYERALQKSLAAKKDEHDGPTNGKHAVAYKKDDQGKDEPSVRVGNFINTIITRQITGKKPLEDLPVTNQASASMNKMISNSQADKRYMQTHHAASSLQQQQMKQLHQMQMQNQKMIHSSENEVVMIEELPESRSSSSHQQSNKDHNVTHHSQQMIHHPKSLQAHVDSVITREFTMHEPKKESSNRNMSSSRPPMEVLRSESSRSQLHHQQQQQQQASFDQWRGRSQAQQQHGTNSIKTSHHSNDIIPISSHYTSSQLASHYTHHNSSHHPSSQATNHRSSSSPHPVNLHNSSSGSHHPGQQGAPHMTVDERQIIRMAQPASRDSSTHKVRTPPGAVNYNSSETQSVPSSQQQQQQQQQHPSVDSSRVISFDYVKDKLTHAMRYVEDKEECDISSQQEAERRAIMQEAVMRSSGGPPTPHNALPPPPPHAGSRSGTPAQHSADASMEEKRKRLEGVIDSRPPSRPRSGPSIGVGGNKVDGRPEDVADSPQSGEMVIDETPRIVDGGSGSHHNNTDTSTGGDKGQTNISSSTNTSSSNSYTNSSSNNASHHNSIQQQYVQQQQSNYGGGNNYNRHRHNSPATSSHGPPPSSSTHSTVVTSSSHGQQSSSGHSVAWSVAAGNTPSPAQHRSTPNYEPNVEPVSDDE